MQYSYLPSAMSMMTDRDTPREAGKALFDKVYAVWRTLPADDRPQLVVGGESLGSYGGQAAFASADDMLARAQGGVWVGTPSFTEIWQSLTARRNEGSPEIVPVVDAGLHIRFAANSDQLTTTRTAADSARGTSRATSTPSTRPIPSCGGTRPCSAPSRTGCASRAAPTSTPTSRGSPFVTFWQLTTDMAVGHDPPDGYGHRYGPELVPAWGSVLGGSPTDDYSKLVAGIEETVDRVA